MCNTTSLARKRRTATERAPLLTEELESTPANHRFRPLKGGAFHRDSFITRQIGSVSKGDGSHVGSKAGETTRINRDRAVDIEGKEEA